MQIAAKLGWEQKEKWKLHSRSANANASASASRRSNGGKLLETQINQISKL